MRKAVYFLVYLATLVLGIMLLINARDVYETPIPGTLQSLVLAGGIIFLIGGAVGAIAGSRPVYTKKGQVKARPFYWTATWISCMIWGVITIIFSKFFTTQLCLTVGIDLIFASIAQIVWTLKTSKPEESYGWFIPVPVIAAGLGVYCITLLTGNPTTAQSCSTSAIIGGLTLLVYSINGVISLKNRVNPAVAVTTHEKASGKKEPLKKETAEKPEDKTD